MQGEIKIAILLKTATAPLVPVRENPRENEDENKGRGPSQSMKRTLSAEALARASDYAD